MASESTNDGPAATPSPGLPPVQPPSGRFIVQLFVVPGLIIAAVVLVVLLLNFAVRSSRDPAYFLQQLDSDNADIRWRGASDLAQILKRTEPATLRWKTDPRFALDLAERLDATFKRLCNEEKALADKAVAGGEENKKLIWRKLNKDRDLLAFLAAALGEFHAPVGAPVLCEILKHDNSPDLIGNTHQRRQALAALMNMGGHVRAIGELPAESRARMITGLKEESAGDSARAAWARTALYYLDKNALPTKAEQNVELVDATLARCAADPDRFLRKLTAMAFTFWDGPLAEPTLLKLANDDGWGTLLEDDARE
ncbi:MAG: hypothetical protein HYX68_10650 [Planctomycetes bacterium]|nr:hypothetical protein [Planctomycetota bacterium]